MREELYKLFLERAQRGFDKLSDGRITRTRMQQIFENLNHAGVQIDSLTNDGQPMTIDEGYSEVKKRAKKGFITEAKEIFNGEIDEGDLATEVAFLLMNLGVLDNISNISQQGTTCTIDIKEGQKTIAVFTIVEDCVSAIENADILIQSLQTVFENDVSMVQRGERIYLHSESKKVTAVMDKIAQEVKRKRGRSYFDVGRWRG